MAGKQVIWRGVVLAVGALLLVLLAVVVTTSTFQITRVAGRDMEPTLKDRQRVIINKLAYRLGDPRSGDVVLLLYPLDPTKSLVSRCVATAGDRVRITRGHVYVNDEPLHDDYVASDFATSDDWGPQVVPAGYYFVLGDHRRDSSDSRRWGFIPRQYIVGKVVG